MGMKAMVQAHIVSGSPILELYVNFSNTDERGWRSTYLPVREARMKEQVESPTTQLCALDFSHDRQNIQQSGFNGNPEYWTPTRHLVSGFDLNFSQPMFNAGSTYRRMTSSSNNWQSTCDFGYFDKYTRRDDILLTTSTVKGTTNPGDADGDENEEDTESNAGPIRELGVDDLEIAIFFEPEPIPFELEPIPTKPKYGGSDGEGSSKIAEEDPRFRDY
ncbi:hypothetical protein J1N35_038518 [Gossypium stocksii]|uniref:Uncharacterized protein n=1 Tax=Gossypium stocksii TaxID=47602 RepID=A0A9D3ZMP0_9ROSI|nr:hypothetical protein J1N35_038518 [Gossypium stocksii]